MSFDRVKQILDDCIAAWELENGASDVKQAHSATVTWNTRENLLNAVFQGKRLIQPELVGMADVARVNLIVDIKTGFDGYRMPPGGPYIPDNEILEIEQWIRDGCLP